MSELQTGRGYRTSRLAYGMWTIGVPQIASFLRLCSQAHRGAIRRTALAHCSAAIWMGRRLLTLIVAPQAHTPPSIIAFFRWQMARAWDQILHALCRSSIRLLCTCTSRGLNRRQWRTQTGGRSRPVASRASFTPFSIPMDGRAPCVDYRRSPTAAVYSRSWPAEIGEQCCLQICGP